MATLNKREISCKLSKMSVENSINKTSVFTVFKTLLCKSYFVLSEYECLFYTLLSVWAIIYIKGKHQLSLNITII